MRIENLMEHHMPHGWSAEIRGAYSYYHAAYTYTVKMTSAVDAVGRVATGFVHIGGLSRDEAMHAIHVEQCRMDARLTHELRLEDENGVGKPNKCPAARGEYR